MSDKKTDIFNCGRELFYSKGFKDTNISDITKMLGIGVGTFYNYYASKEKLFFEIYFKENDKLKKCIMESLNLNDDPVTLVKEFVTQNLNAMNSNLILKEWYNRDLDISSQLEQNYSDENRKSDDYSRIFYGELLKKWKDEGKIRADIDNELLLAFFNSLAYIDCHKKDIGIQHFPQIIEYLVEFIMKGLTNIQK